jgi:SNF2 family DNA or RNA helicase
MQKWSVAGPVARLSFSAPEEGQEQLTEFHENLPKIAGVRDRSGFWLVPFNALHAVETLRKNYPEVVTVAGAWEKPPKQEISWAPVEQQLREEGSLQPWVYEFFTPYQKEAIAFAWSKDGCHFWHPTGSGKSLSGITAALSVPGSVVVVTRAASRLQYAREIERFTRSRAYVVRPASESSGRVTVKGESFRQFRSRHKGKGLSPKEVGRLWQENIAQHGMDEPPTLENYVKSAKSKGFRPFVVIGWEALSDNLDALAALKPGCVVFDEIHRGKSSKRYEVVALADLPEDPEEASKIIRKDAMDAKNKNGFVKNTDDGRRMFLPVMNTASAAAMLGRAALKRLGTTATPIANRVRDLWGQLDTIEPNAWGSATVWQDRYCDRRPGTYGGFDTSGESNRDELKLRLQHVAHILDYRETHRQLPKKRRQSYYIAPSDQCDESGGFSKELKEAQKRGATAVLEVKLAQAASRKRKAVLGLIEDHLSSKHKIVVFTGRRRDCDELGEIVRKSSGVKETQATVWAAHGDQSTEARQVIVDEYMAHPGPCVLVATGHAFGESLNLQDTDAALFVMLPYTPGQLRQWEGRFSRLGQKRPVTLYYVIAENTVDEHIAQILIDKLPSVEKIAQDVELAEAAVILSGSNPNESNESFATAILDAIDTTDNALDDWD